MKAFNRLLAMLFLLGITSCSRQETPPRIRDTFRLQGGWALYEIGRSTADGVNVKSITTAGPVQALSFGPEGRLRTQGDDLKDFADGTRYQVDSTQTGLQLQLAVGQNSDLVYSVGLTIQGDKMTITPPCNGGGCYFKFNRLLRTD